MFTLGVIEESLENAEVLSALKPFFYSQRVEEVPDDPYPVWHVNEYHVSDEKIDEVAELLARETKLTWYAHAFNDDVLVVILKGKAFRVAPHRDETWEEMLTYAEGVKVEKRYIESIPLGV
ncbi:MAG: hypothetical protein FWB80_12415 [Defluviitaleaceae bacterium]|nr:hypothetical protein [Defluviitaleaceae bacterium]